MAADEFREWLLHRVADLLEIAPERVSALRPLADLGLSSEQAVGLAAEVEARLGRRFGPELFYNHASLEALAHHLTSEPPAGVPTTGAPTSGGPVAIVGIGCAFPGAGVGPSAFLRFLRDRGDAVVDVPPDRWDADAVYDPDPTVRGKTCSRWGGFLDGIDQFDPGAFGIAPAEAARMDPQQRLLLEASWHAFEDAGVAPARLAGSRTGVFVGISNNEYGRRRFDDPADIEATTTSGNAFSIAANRLSYVYDLKGPSLAVDTACSSSLMAVHLAVQSLRRGESSLAIAGGVNVLLSPDVSVAFSRAGVMSPDGRCKPFDAQANGYVRGEGVGLVVLKRLNDALADGDPIYALVLGSATHQDGRSNGLMAPHGGAQEAVVAAACHDAGVDPGELDYVEAHGTGTMLGDLIEARALGATVGRRTGGRGVCRIGSVKSNLGHLESAAGVAGLIKTALCLREGEFVPSLHCDTPNPSIPFTELGLEVGATLEPWPEAGGRRLAGVSSFGFGGANVHVVLASAPATAPPTTAGAGFALGLSAPDEISLHHLASDFAEAIRQSPDNAAGLAAAAAARTTGPHRLALTAAGADEACETLRAAIAGAASTALQGVAKAEARVALAFSGQGGLFAGVGLGLFQSEPIFRERLLECDAQLRGSLGGSVLPHLFSEGAVARGDQAQPALFALQMSLLALLESWGVRPVACLGHSAGEVAAAVASGWIDLAEGARLIVQRSRAIQPARGAGGMGLVLADEQTLRTFLADVEDVSIAADNGPTSFVISGPVVAVSSVLALAAARGVQAFPIAVDFAAHGPQMKRAAQALQQALSSGGWRTPDGSALPLYSTVLARRVGPGDLTAAYWGLNVRRTVRFREALAALVGDGIDAVIEIGPHPSLLRDIGVALGAGGRGIATLDRRSDDLEGLRRTACALFVCGGLPSLPAGSAPRALAAPPRPWAQRSRMWFDPPPRIAQAQQRGYLGPALDLATAPGQTIWTSRLDRRTHPEFDAWRLGGDPAVPAAAQIDMLFTAAEGLLGPTAALEDVRLQAVLPLPEAGPLDLQVAADTDETGARVLTLFVRQPYETAWRRVATARVAAAESLEGGASTGSPSPQGRCAGEDLYPALEAAGLECGPHWRVLEFVCVTPDATRATLRRDQRCPVATARHGLDPRLLEAAFQTLGATGLSAPASDLCMPIGVARVRRRASAAPAAAIICRPGGATGAGGDLAVVDAEGGVLIALDGVTTTPGRAEAERRRALHTALDRWIYRVEWTPAEPASEPGDESVTRLVFAGDGGPGDALVDRLRAGGDRVVRVLAAEAEGGRTEDDVRIRPGQPGDLEALFRLADARRPFGVIYAWSLAAAPDAPPTADLIQLGEIAMALQRTGAPPSRTLTVLTAGAWRLEKGEASDPGRAMLWGLANAAALEAPGLRIRAIDLPHDPAAWRSQIEAARREVAAEGLEDRVALRPTGRRVARLRHAALAPAPDLAGGIHLITGGSGALAMIAARALIAHGAETVVLAARSLRDGEEALRVGDRTGRLVRFTCDVADAGAVRDLVQRIAGLGRLRNVIHAAGVLDDGALGALTPARYARVLRPKAVAAEALIDGLAGTELDALVFFSSAASVLGSPGQANYCAANAFLDALALKRPDLARRVTSIAWGPWSGEGMADLEGRGTADRLDLARIPPEIGGLLAVRALYADSGQLMVTAFDPVRVARAFGSAPPPPLLWSLDGAQGQVGGEIARTGLRPRLSTGFIAPRTAVEARLTAIWAEVLGVEGLGVRDDLFELGGDSIAAAQVLAKTKQTFGVEADAEATFAQFTVEALAQAVETALIAAVSELDDAEVERLLAAAAD
jgi:acyl transferase domain-containing protein/NADP-dependent 3-hydroxy acid dehydrogenase YdfG/acyl carrier protein